jgi:hypothetical protein
MGGLRTKPELAGGRGQWSRRQTMPTKRQDIMVELKRSRMCLSDWSSKHQQRRHDKRMSVWIISWMEAQSRTTIKIWDRRLRSIRVNSPWRSCSSSRKKSKYTKVSRVPQGWRVEAWNITKGNCSGSHQDQKLSHWTNPGRVTRSWNYTTTPQPSRIYKVTS